MASTKPQIKIPDFQLEVREFFKEFGSKVKELQNTFNTYTTFIIGVLTLGFLVLLFTLATILMQAWQFSSTYQDEAKQLNIEKDTIKNTIDSQEIIIKNQQDIKKELDDIKASLNK